ncbi:MAG: hypothetical protein N0A16_08955 [Blastocatellia bacterium]|nr:hypothetical protein [Blastocatellia bacterium]MCS7157843.1 hypothetical protein [Blastocatellia bacterium]MCX7753420.1 hypothetical protein [Blastocatellia bacterium]MDW8168079.1 hypothetical protein [Acidobacteriota bacterium]MDW8257672.1 hypothetical protein [Acidobacteriota bacterium]
MREPLELRPWRGTRAETAFVERLRIWSALDEAGRRQAALAHWSTCWFQRAALDVYLELLNEELSCEVFGSEKAIASFSAVEQKMWSFLQLAKGALDAVAREINFVYWHVDAQHRFFDPTGRTRWVTFYTVRERLFGLKEFRDDPLARVLEARTRAETADRIYRDLSHLAAASLTAPRLIGRVERSNPTQGETTLRAGDARIYIPDDPRQWPATYERDFEVNTLFPAILRWLEHFTDEVYDKLELRLRGEGR